MFISMPVGIETVFPGVIGCIDKLLRVNKVTF